MKFEWVYKMCLMKSCSPIGTAFLRRPAPGKPNSQAKLSVARQTLPLLPGTRAFSCIILMRLLSGRREQSFGVENFVFRFDPLCEMGEAGAV